MEKTMKIRMKAVLLAAFLTASGVGGCASGSDSSNIEERKAIIDDYAGILLLQDEDSAGFDEALAAVGGYLESPTAQQKKAVMEVLEDTISQMEADSADCKSYEASQEFGQMLEKQGISLVEYQMNADSRYTYLQDYIQDLEFLQEFLEYSDEGEAFMQDLKMTYYFMSEEQKQMQGYNYTGVNYWFAGWGEEETAYVKEQVLDKFKSFSAEDAQWKESRDDVEAAMNAYLDEVEELYDDWTAYIGESWEELNQMR